MQAAFETHPESSLTLDYGDSLRADMLRLWLNCLQRSARHVASWARGTELQRFPTSSAATPYSQAASIWFHRLRTIDENEIKWGLKFFKDAILSAVPDVIKKFDASSTKAFCKGFNAALHNQLHSWVGGDRDGNLNVTTERTEYALKRGCETIVAHYLSALTNAAAHFSPSALVAPRASECSGALAQISHNSAATDRNQNEPFRQTRFCNP